ncbi:MAG: replication protein RepA [Candidatus Contendobacter sp.]|nr:replication protein RepA [Candidatus Contendobacter sp.]
MNVPTIGPERLRCAPPCTNLVTSSVLTHGAPAPAPAIALSLLNPAPIGGPLRGDGGPPAALVRLVVSGNRCGHDPACPRWFEPPPHHAPHPKILVKLQEAVRAYFADPAVLPSLNAANGSARQQRSERREACLSLLGALIHYLDLVTLRVGIPQADGTFKGLTLEFLAERAGLGLRRAERACRDLRRAGLVEIYPIAQKTEDDRYKGLPAIRRLPVSLFKVFGLSRWLQHERDKASRRQRRQRHRREAAETETAIGRRELALDAARRRAKDRAAAAEPATTAEADPAEAARRETARATLGTLRNLLKGRPPA